jgi:L,D-transpeptidase YbiS
MKHCSIVIRLGSQTLDLVEDGTTVVTFQVSTSARGEGERLGSEQTPRGKHRIKEMIGAGLHAGSVLVGRKPTGEIY